MSTIDKLMILGIRAFNTRHGETIKFEPPLTLVAGVNGSGKTTIIECLKFATTGILPPGSKLGGAFIHDPGLDGEREVMAQVKLGFHAPNGTRLVATRSLQLSVKKASRSQKTLEALLLMDRHGQKTTLSTRVAELDQQVPNYLGVSTSLLENVIFCHQEDSLWPLAESSVLKRKFDDIFEAAKYTKAVDELKKIRKKHKDDLGRQEEVAKSAKKDRERARKVQAQCRSLQAEVESLREQASSLQQKMDKAQQLASDAHRESEEYAQILGRLEGYRIEADKTEKSLKNLKMYLKEISETDEWLENALAEFDATLSRYEQDKHGKLDRYTELQAELDLYKQQHTDKLTQKGQLEQARKDHHHQLERRRKLVQETASKYQMRGYDDLTDEDKVEDFLFKVKKLAKDRSNALARAHREADAEKDQGLASVNQLRERKAALQFEKDTAKRDITANDRKAGETQKLIDQIDIDEGSKAKVESRIEELVTRLDRGHGPSQIIDYEAKIDQANAELVTLEREATRLNNELIQSTKRAGEVAQLSHLQQELKENKRSLETLTEAHSGRISKLIGDWTIENLRVMFDNVMADAVSEVNETIRERDVVSREMDRVLDKQKILRGEILNKKRQTQHHEEMVRKAIDGEISEYEETLVNAQSRLDFARDTAKGLGGLADWFQKVLDTAVDRHACRMCERPFKGPEDPGFKRFKTKIEGLIKKSSLDESKQELEDATQDYKRVSDANVSFETWKVLTRETIPALEQESQQSGIEHDKLLRRVEVHDKKVEGKEIVQRDLEGISKVVSSIVTTQEEINRLSSRVEDLSAQQSQGNSLKTLEDIEDAIRSTRDKVDSTRKTLTHLTNEQATARREAHDLELQLKDKRAELSAVNVRLEKKAELVARSEEFQIAVQKRREIIEKADVDTAKIESDLATANARHEDLKQRLDGRLRDLDREAAAIASSVNALELVTDAIKSYLDEGGDAKLSTTERDIKGLQQHMEEAEVGMTQMTKEINRLEKQLQDSENVKRHYADNLRYRRETRELKSVREEIEELDSKNAHIDRDRLLAVSKRRTEEYHNCSGRREGIVGEMKQKDIQLGQLLEEYETDLKDAALRYREAHIKHETTKAAVEDIGRYSTALDRAIMKYHALKMEEVNAIIQELWQKCYQGSDIDSIMIKSDVEAKSTARTHSYRVVMLKRDVELDMRGRCSAGQKVLASIIIRLALAECFSRDCGVIALDEPTTNLDRDNIEALAGALHEIIKARQGQNNFQLIIITHDEAFLRKMRCGDFTDYYYRISRDKEDHSIIERQSILEVME